MNTSTRLTLAAGVIGLASAISIGSPRPAPGDIVDTAVNAGRFDTLAAALDAADLVGALQGPGPFTVFAPTDSAFAKLPAGTVEFLLQPENKQALTDILLYHVVPGEFFAAATEAFFDCPGVLRDEHPSLYAVFSDYYRQDPAARAG